MERGREFCLLHGAVDVNQGYFETKGKDARGRNVQ